MLLLVTEIIVKGIQATEYMYAYEGRLSYRSMPHVF